MSYHITLHMFPASEGHLMETNNLDLELLHNQTRVLV